MATYAFKALDLSGSPTKGEIEATDKQAVASQRQAAYALLPAAIQVAEAR